MNVLHFIYRTFSFILGIVASAVFLSAVAYTVTTKFAGYQAMPVLSGSMEPTMKTGSIAFVRPVAATDVKKGDVVTFQQPDAPEGTFITHRVERLHLTDEGVIYTTKGDANNFADPWRLKAVGSVGLLEFDVPYVGYAVVYLGLRDVRVALFVTLCAAFLLLALTAIWRKDKPASKRPVAASRAVRIDNGLPPVAAHSVSAGPGAAEAATSGRFISATTAADTITAGRS